MAKANETIADIIKWLRLPRDGENGYLAAWRDEIADSLEAAHKREIDEMKEQIEDLCQQRDVWSKRADELKTKCDEQYAKLKQVGNVAKLREALELCDRIIQDGTIVCACDIVDEARTVVRAALAAPQRNCDKVKTSWDVLKKWHEGLDTANAIVRMLDWLLAPATEQEGGAK